MERWLGNLISKTSWPDENKIHSWPNSIILQYSQLQKVAEDENLYGVMLQTKDLFEEIIKLPTIMSLIVLDNLEDAMSNEKSISVTQKLLSQPMTMGAWYSLALHIVKKQKELSIPLSLATILKKTTMLFQQPITDGFSDIINWRNNSIGHGSLRFSESDSYKEEIESIFHLLSEYADGKSKYSVNNLYDNIVLKLDVSDEHLLIDGIVYRFKNFAAQTDAITYLFDSYYPYKRMTKFRSESGSQFSKRMQYFDDLFQVCFRQSNSIEKIRADFISRENDMLLEYLNNPETYIKPRYIVEELESALDELGKGVILVRMERGMGKTAFASRLDGLFTSRKECLISNAVVRCYHVSNCDLKGTEDYYHSFNYTFKHSYSPLEDIRESGIESIDIKRSSSTIKADIAHALRKYHEWYKRDYTAFVIDGIDELSCNSKEILLTIPNADQLTEGTFIILLSRFAGESTVDKMADRYIHEAECLADKILDFRRKTPENIELLLQYIGSFYLTDSSDDIDRIIEKADYRMLFVKPYMVLSGEIGNVKDEEDLIRQYYDRLEMHLSKKQRRMLAGISLVIALFRPISIEEMNQYLDCFDITYQNIGLLNDLKPLMTVSHVHGNTYYSFANTMYEQYVLRKYESTLTDTLQGIIQFIVQETETFRKQRGDIKEYSIRLFEEYYHDGVITLEQLRNNIIERHYFYSMVISIIYRKAEENEVMWQSISDKKTLDAIVVFLGMFAGESYNLYGYGKELGADPFEYSQDLLCRYVRDDVPHYIRDSINEYGKYIFSLYQKGPYPVEKSTRDYFLNHDASRGTGGKLHDVIIQEIRNKDFSAYHWLLLFIWLDENDEITQALLETKQLDKFLEYKMQYIEQFPGDSYYKIYSLTPYLDERITLESGTEEKLLNTILNGYLIETNYQLTEYQKTSIINYCEKIRQKAYSINPINMQLLKKLSPDCSFGFDTATITSLCMKIKDCLLHWDDLSDDIVCKEVATLITILKRMDDQFDQIDAIKLDDEIVHDTLLIIYQTAIRFADRKNLRVFLENTGIRENDQFICFLLLCTHNKIGGTKNAWEYWLGLLFQDISTWTTKPVEIFVDELYSLLKELQGKEVFQEDDAFWLQTMDRWVTEFDTFCFLKQITSPAYSETSTDFLGKIFCTNNTIKLLSIYSMQGKYHDRALEIFQSLKKDITMIMDKYQSISDELVYCLQRHELRFENSEVKKNLLGKDLCSFDTSIHEKNVQAVKSILINEEDYYEARNIRNIILRAFDYYFETCQYGNAIDLCDEMIAEVKNSWQKNEGNVFEFELFVAFTVIKSFFDYIGGTRLSLEQHISELDKKDISSCRLLPRRHAFGDDGLTASLFSFKHDIINGCVKKPYDYQNDYLRSFFSGNGCHELGSLS